MGSEMCIRDSLYTNEIWNLAIFDNTINQILYFKEAERFSKISQIFSLKKSMQHLIDILEQIVRTGYKILNNPGLTGVVL